ncbi:hypothetical protein HD598_002117 [Neomicrococcus aestuarii]|uniref:Uncharacterized protein n=1 Tax=Neomicrococcus aestuarii TaxID=556325 RepID=A0A7W8TWI6_9MICC|nr:hypothetical protein [Neomicrococcus aestuarii]
MNPTDYPPLSHVLAGVGFVFIIILAPCIAAWAL